MRLLFGRNPRWVVHTPLVAVAYVLSTALTSDVEPAGYVRSLVFGVLSGGILALLGWAVTRNRWDGALLATAILGLVVSPASLARVGSLVTGYFGAPIGRLLIGAGLIAALGLVGIRTLQARRRRLPLPKPSPEALNLLAIALVGTVVGTSVLSGLNLETAAPVPMPSGWRAPTSGSPDIVIILLDGYPRSDVLQRRLATDDTAFLDGLRQRGFDVATTNHSNYTLTELTLPSMFQMQYLDQIPSVRPLIGTSRAEIRTLHEAAQSGQAFSILGASGYQVTMVSPGWEHVTFRQVPDRLLDSGELTDLEEWLIHRTWLIYLLDAVWPSVFTASLRDRIVHSFDALDRFATQKSSRPRFLFLHVPGPHLPLAVNADGSPTALTASRYEGLGRGDFRMSDAAYEAAWGSELDYLHDRVLQGIDGLLASQRGRDTVVVVMSDHGYNSEARLDDPQARLSNLLAVRSPQAPHLAGDLITPVNLLRVVFNRYLETDLDLLPNRYFLQGDRPLDLTEIADPDQAPPTQ